MRDAHLPAEGGDIDDAALSKPTHMGKNSQRSVNRAPEDDVHSRIEIFQRHGVDRTDPDDACIIHQDLDPAVMLQHFANHSIHLRAIGDVAGNSEDSRTESG